MPDRLTVAERAATAGASVAMTAFRTDLEVEEKGSKTDVVTQADRDAQTRVAEVIRDAYPDDDFVGEEEDVPKTIPASGSAWVVDPIDGTANFVRGHRTWGTAVAAVVDGDAVAAANEFPVLSDTYVVDSEGVRRNGDAVSVSDHDDPERCTVAPTNWWDFDRRGEWAALVAETVHRFGDIRRNGCSQATLSWVADGSLDGAVTTVDTLPWDTVAGVRMIRAAGGRVTDVEGDRWRPDSTGLVASYGRIHEDLLAAAQSVEATD